MNVSMKNFVLVLAVGFLSIASAAVTPTHHDSDTTLAVTPTTKPLKESKPSLDESAADVHHLVQGEPSLKIAAHASAVPEPSAEPIPEPSAEPVHEPNLGTTVSEANKPVTLSTTAAKHSSEEEHKEGSHVKPSSTTAAVLADVSERQKRQMEKHEDLNAKAAHPDPMKPEKPSMASKQQDQPPSTSTPAPSTSARTNNAPSQAVSAGLLIASISVALVL
ncbi:unnamed protein product [Notodromas monacha]|uniref:Uncharacterized protein n=1 Tax=Notodromas monacha TaxID=399045 RepID=A0A7R9BW09_9CRUS|nr:unnamed protein product [Notodromas monacha]CAG0922826.1 unnamed protein product [Notodromas monacha]